MNNYCVYCHTTPSGRRYVGISINPQKRWSNGEGYKLNYLFYRAIKKYGWDNIRHEILFDNLTEQEAKQIEIDLINRWKLIDHRFGYNLETGGGGPFSESTKTKMSFSRKGNNNCVGRILSNSTKAKISESLKTYYSNNAPTFSGKHHKPETIMKLKQRVFSEETKEKMRLNHYDSSGTNNPSAKPVRKLDLGGKIIKDYPYAKAAAEENGLCLSSIIKCCRGKQNTCGGYKWEYI